MIDERIVSTVLEFVDYDLIHHEYYVHTIHCPDPIAAEAIAKREGVSFYSIHTEVTDYAS